MIVNQQLNFDTVKPQIFIIEGPDASGKTTLAKAMANKLNAAYFHATYKAAPLSQSECQLNILESAVVNTTSSGLHVVLDRLWPSQVVYDEVLGRIPTNMSAVDVACEFYGVVYIFCKGDLERYNKNVDSDHPYSSFEYTSLQTNYDLMEESIKSRGICKVINYDLTKEGQYIDLFIKTLLDKVTGNYTP